MSDFMDVVKLMANRPNALEQGQAAFKNYLQIENGINQNFQDALTFNQNVAAINAANAKKEFADRQAYNKAKGEEEAMTAQLANAVDPKTGQYRTQSAVNDLVFQNYLSMNPYGRAAAYSNLRQAAQQDAARLAAIDPVAGQHLLAKYGIAEIPQGFALTQDPNTGELAVKNSSGYVRKVSPEVAGYFVAHPEGVAKVDTENAYTQKLNQFNSDLQMSRDAGRAALQHNYWQQQQDYKNEHSPQQTGGISGEKMLDLATKRSEVTGEPLSKSMQEVAQAIMLMNSSYDHTPTGNVPVTSTQAGVAEVFNVPAAQGNGAAVPAQQPAPAETRKPVPLLLLGTSGNKDADLKEIQDEITSLEGRLKNNAKYKGTTAYTQAENTLKFLKQRHEYIGLRTPQQWYLDQHPWENFKHWAGFTDENNERKAREAEARKAFGI